jgi:hypothetical protein
MLKFRNQVKNTAKLDAAIEKLPMDIERPLAGAEEGGHAMGPLGGPDGY